MQAELEQTYPRLGTIYSLCSVYYPNIRQRSDVLNRWNFLKTGFYEGIKFGPDDWRRELVVFEQPLFEGEHFLKNLLKVDKLKEYTAQTGRTVAQLAIAWVLSNPVVSVALTGVRNPTELEQNVEAADWILTEGERAEVTGIAGHQRVE